MQIIYFTIFMTTLIVYAVMGLSPAEEQFKTDRKVVATHMTAWHKGAALRCADVACNGVVDPKPYMYPSMTSAPAFSATRFTTRYDATSKLLVTSVTAAVTGRGITNDVVMSGLSEMVEGESSMIGVFDKGAAKADFTSLTGVYKKKSIAIPAGIAAGIVDGSPVIVTNM